MGCRGISIRDFFPVLSCCTHRHDASTDPLLMADLKSLTPEYISNVAVDYWRKESSLKAPSYAVMSLSPEGNERIDHQPGEVCDEIKLSPGCVHQTDAMVTSAAVMALSPEQAEPFRDLQIMLGLTIRKGFRSNPKETVGCSPCLAKVWRTLNNKIFSLISRLDFRFSLTPPREDTAVLERTTGSLPEQRLVIEHPVSFFSSLCLFRLFVFLLPRSLRSLLPLARFHSSVLETFIPNCYSDTQREN